MEEPELIKALFIVSALVNGLFSLWVAILLAKLRSRQHK